MRAFLSLALILAVSGLTAGLARAAEPPPDPLREQYEALVETLGVFRWGPTPLDPDATNISMSYVAEDEGRPVVQLGEGLYLRIGDRFTASWFIGLRAYSRTEVMSETPEGGGWVTAAYEWRLMSEDELRDYYRDLIDDADEATLDELINEAKRQTRPGPFDLDHPDSIRGPLDIL